MDEKYPLALPAGTVLAGQYIIEKVLGQGGFGITYEARDHKNGDRIAVKEFFPDTMATRNGTTVMPYNGERGESFTYGKECFLQEAETLAQFIGNENIVRIHSYFEEYGTAYFVMDFVEGTSFDAYIKAHDGRLSFDETAKILLPVMNALGAVHSKGVIHRDVTPDNNYITKDGVVKLLDFGAARYSLGDKSRSLDVILKHGFAPKEQYTRRGRQGPFTDVYALGATFYFALTGRRPPDSVERMDEDELIPPSTLGVKLSPSAERAILKALNIQPADRFQSMEEFKNAMVPETEAGKTPVQREMSQTPVQPGSQTVQQRFFTAPEETPQASVQPTASGIGSTIPATAAVTGVTTAPGRSVAGPAESITVTTSDEAESAASGDASIMQDANASENKNEIASDVQKSKQKNLLIPAIASILVVLCIAGIVLFNNSNNRPEPAPSVVGDVPVAEAPKEEPQKEKIKDKIPEDEVQEQQENEKSDDTAPQAPASEQEPESQEAPDSSDAQELSLEERLGRNPYPVIVGNEVNALLDLSEYDQEFNSWFINQSDRKVVLRCISQTDGLYYAIMDNKPCKFDLNGENITDIDGVSKLTELQCLLVSKEYYFAYAGNRFLYCFDRESGKVIGRKEFSDRHQFTFTDTGSLIYLDRDADNRMCIYYIPAGDIGSQECEPYLYKALSVSDGHLIYYDENAVILCYTNSEGISEIVKCDLTKEPDAEDNFTGYLLIRSLEQDEIHLANSFGDEVFYYRKVKNGPLTIESIDMGTGYARTLYECSEDITTVYGLTIKGDGKKIAFSIVNRGHQTYQIEMNRDGTGIEIK